MTIPSPFTQTLPEQAPNRDQPDWVACRFDGFPDFRSDLSIAGLRVVAKWPGNWAWCEDKELQALIMQSAQGDGTPAYAVLRAQLDQHEKAIVAYGQRIQEARKLAVQARDACEKAWRALA